MSNPKYYYIILHCTLDFNHREQMSISLRNLIIEVVAYTRAVKMVE